uniref:PHD finger protein 3 n=1 Tax=Salarias fasciatus TaxID=181472 RepID=A0A672IHT5_SALFA
MKPVKEKPDISPMKRPAENPQSELAPKVQKTQGPGQNKIKPKSPSAANSVPKKSPLASHRAGDHQGPQKHPHPHNSSKVETTHLAHSHPSNSVKTPEEAGQEKSKVKKPEKLLQRQKSKNARSISVEEPQLFIPDNAPVVKKDPAEELAANTDSAWDGNNCCGLCKKHHNNMFMVGCGRCDDWFHGDCVGLDLTKVREMEEEDQMYVCLKCCEEESKKVEPEPPSAPKPEVPAKPEVPDHKPPSHPQNDFSSSIAGLHHKHETKSKTSSASKKPVSVEAIRRNVRDSLKEILTQRLKESDLNISVDRATEVAKKTEKELFHLYKDTDNKYKNKYRSLMFNLKDTKNNVLFKRVLKGEISPANLIRMSPEELASKELAAWRQRENRHTIEMIEKEQREVERRPITKITHKGEIEIESQEPVKTSEPIELEPPPKVSEVPLESPKTPDKKAENDKTEKDTTSQHKSHLFDLHCKICTGRMAPPVEEATTKVIKVATTVVRRQSTKTDEPKSSTAPAADEDLHLTVLEESFRNAHSSYDGRSEEVVFLTGLKSLWRGFIHMHAVAKLVTKAFPVSGILDSLTEDLPDSIQVGGRISPQTVWDYLEKIRATGTKEVCLIRFTPETEEDEISYTLLYAYFSSRKRFGVVSNNLKQVKDMYLIPLGATEKVPHQLVPFDGPGLENNRANLLLGLIIRQRPKRDFLTVDVNESARSIPDIKPIIIPPKETRKTEEDEKLFLSSLTVPHKKEKEKTLDTTEEADEPVAESLEGPSAPENSQEAQKPLRFLPGVLVGWGGELPPLPDVGGKSGATASDTEKNQPAPKTEAPTGNAKSPTAAAPRERFVIKKKEAKPVKTESELPGPADTSAANNSSGKDGAAVNYGASVSLKDKPPDVSTDAFLASLSTGGTETSVAGGTNKGDAGLLSETEKGTTEGSSSSQSEPQAASDPASSSKPPLSGILKKSSAYSTATEDKTTAPQQQRASPPDPSAPKPVPLLSSKRNDLIVPFHQGYLQLAAQAKHKPEEQNRTTVQSPPGKTEDPGLAQPAAEVKEAPCPTADDEPKAASNTQASEPEQDLVTTPTPPASNSTPPFPSQQQQQQQSQVPGSYDYPVAPAPDEFSSPHTQVVNHNEQWAQDSASQAPSTPPSQYSESFSASFHAKRPEERYSDPWERPRNTEDKDHHGRHRDSHHGKKSRHHDREREKKHEHRDRSRHHGHSDDRHAEKRRERHHSDDHSSRHKDRHRHRRDSDYENGRRGSKDSYS